MSQYNVLAVVAGRRREPPIPNCPTLTTPPSTLDPLDPARLSQGHELWPHAGGKEEQRGLPHIQGPIILR